MAFLGEGLRRGRERARLSQEAAAQAAGINRVQLSYYETGSRQPPLATAAALARLYGTTVEALLKGDTEARSSIDVAGVLFRAAPLTLGDHAKAGLRQIDRHLSDYIELATEAGIALQGPGRSPLAGARTTSAKEAAWAARELRRTLNVGGGPLADPFQLLGAHVLVWRLPLGEDLGLSPSGLFYNHPQAGFCIAVNSQMTLGRQVFTLAHELAHAYFHSQAADVIVSMPGGDHGREPFADAFAGEFLVPGDALRQLAGTMPTAGLLADPAVVIQLQRHFGVSFATMRVRLLQERLISREEFGILRDVSPSRLAQALGYRVHPADLGAFQLQPLERFPAQMLLLVRSALDQSVITRGDAAEILGTSTEEIRQLLSRPEAGDEDRRLQSDLEAAAFANRER